jgi:3-oxoacyl-[acyl-carrier protein] reductase
LAELTPESVDDFLHEKVRASLLLVKEFAAQHDGRRGGRVVLMTSGQHIAPMRDEVPYAVSKGALHQATLTLSDALIERGITVNTINPGPTDTGWGLDEIRSERLDAAGPMGPPRRRRASHRLALHRRRSVDHRAGIRLGRRLPTLGARALVR